MGLTRAEQETTIRWDEAEQTVHVWSNSPRTWRPGECRGARQGADGQPATAGV